VTGLLNTQTYNPMKTVSPIHFVHLADIIIVGLNVDFNGTNEICQWIVVKHYIFSWVQWTWIHVIVCLCWRLVHGSCNNALNINLPNYLRFVRKHLIVITQPKRILWSATVYLHSSNTTASNTSNLLRRHESAPGNNCENRWFRLIIEAKAKAKEMILCPRWAIIEVLKQCLLDRTWEK